MSAAQHEQDSLTATRRFESIARTFEGLTDVAPYRARAAELRSSGAVKRALDEERRATAFENTTRDRLPSAVAAFLASGDTPAAGNLARDLGIPRLQSIAKESSPRGLAAQRLLEAIYTQVNFYLPQQVHGPKALTLKAVAEMIHAPK